MKPKLQSVTNYKLMSLLECAKALNWNIREEDDTYYFTCDCSSSKINCSGFFETEIISCENCKKRIVNMFSPICKSNSTCVILRSSEFEIEQDEDGNDKIWIADDGKGGITD